MLHVLKTMTITLVAVCSVFVFKNRTLNINEQTPDPLKPSMEVLVHSENERDLGKDLIEISTLNNKNNRSDYDMLHEQHSDSVDGFIPIISPCEISMGYKLGTLDERFGLTKEVFLDEIKNAEYLWEEAAKKDLFFYDEKGSLTINLVYDERQRNTERINYLALEIDNAKLSAETLKESYENDKLSHEEDLAIFIKEVEEFKKDQDTYQAEVAYFNTQGGAPRTDYERLTQEKDLLQQEATRLDAKQSELSLAVESINVRVKKYNEFVVYINSLIRDSNALGGKKFTEGRFVPSTNTIDIYSYKDTTKLRRVLTHELGHALGVDHTTTRNSIMYSVNIGTNTSLSVEDIEALQRVCK
jgi:hypothetical protein